jgi:pyroglutamyl-peptidase
MTGRVLIAGFEPYGGRALNPAARLATALDGQRIAGATMVGRLLPVAFAGLRERLEACLAEVRPSIALAVGLAPGEAMIRLERFGVNLADFEIPDNAGARMSDAPILPEGVTALAATLPLRAIERALLAGGIPARISNTAGTYLCNAALYTLLASAARAGTTTRCGFIHLPYLPEQVAETLARAREGTLEFHQRADVASMDFAVMERALRLIVAVSAETAA